MKSLVDFGKKLEHFCYNKTMKPLVFHVNSFWIQLVYFLFISFVGYLGLKISNPRTSSSSSSSSFILNDIDIFFTSVSATTVSSMSTVEMEVFSNTQLIIITILMLLGGEVFTSMLELQLKRSKFHTFSDSTHKISVLEVSKEESDLESNNDNQISKSSLIKRLCYVILGYLVVVQVGGSSLVAIYLGLNPNSRNLLSKKGLHMQTFSTFLVVSTFTNCGFVPTNENMIVFKKNSVLLLIVMLLTLLGGTLYGPTLRFLIWGLGKITKRVEYSYMLRNPKELGYNHLMPSLNSWFLVCTVFGFLIVQFLVFCCLEWHNSKIVDGMSWFEKLVAIIFQIVSTRHSGETVFDLSVISPAILVVFIVMMYFPPCTSFWPMKQQEDDDPRSGKQSKIENKSVVECVLFSQMSYLVIFIILICIVEREHLKGDPLNFSILNITLEVISAYGNVGYSTGYSCARQLKQSNSCKDAMYGLVGRWSKFGKIILIIVMFFGRLKKFNINGGQAWKIS
ncbi:sodium transporter HKT1-like [Mercurialis annua]|uniref:sodium transporter HKT1-like n=1 Tax=Mercurialis annua TaxID=3986 RepID=UPI00215F34A0|nr:sodium transporter HKT1-like [Mercurialis annua]